MPLTPEAKVIHAHLAGFLARSSKDAFPFLNIHPGNSGMQVFLISCETDHTVAGTAPASHRIPF